MAWTATDAARAQPAAEMSPVAQFQLAGWYRIVSVRSEGQALNNQATGKPTLVAVASGQTSGHWDFAEVPGTALVRIRNRLRNSYLQDGRGQLFAEAAAASNPASHWAMEPVDGAPYTRFRNVATNRYLVATGSGFDMVEAPATDIDGYWQLSSAPMSPVAGTPLAATAAVASFADPVRSRAYESALANCRELGGYWTGTTCRAARGARPASCGKGWVWSEDAGECQWDGGEARRCPPWLAGSPPNCQSEMTCRGGTLRTSRHGYMACDCPPGTAIRGGFPNFRCSASVGAAPVYVVPLLAATIAAIALARQKAVTNSGKPVAVVGGTPTGTRANACKSGQLLSTGCFCPPQMVKRNGACLAPTVPLKSTTTTTTTAVTPKNCTEGQKLSSGCVCAAPLTVLAGSICGKAKVVRQTQTQSKCAEGQKLSSGCLCASPLKEIAGGVCGKAKVVRQTQTQSKCAEGQKLSSGCICAAPLKVISGGICGKAAATTTTGVKKCSEGQKVASGCACLSPLKVSAGVCGK